MMLYLTKQLYKDFELIYKISEIVDLSIFFNIAFITTSILNLYIILWGLNTKILYITHLYFIKD